MHLARTGHRAALVPRRAEHAKAIATTRMNADYLPDVAIPASVDVTFALDSALATADVVLLACPAQALRETAQRLRGDRPGRFAVSLAKGLELGTHLRPSEVISAVLPDAHVGSLTGPTNALGVARGVHP